MVYSGFTIDTFESVTTGLWFTPGSIDTFESIKTDMCFTPGSIDRFEPIKTGLSQLRQVCGLCQVQLRHVCG